MAIALLFAYFLLRQNRIAWLLAITAQVIAAPTYITEHDPGLGRSNHRLVRP